VRRLVVVGTSQTRDRIEQDDHVLTVLDHALGLLDHDLGHLAVPRGRLVERRTDDLDGLAGLALHFRDFLGPLVDQQNDELDLRMICGDGIGHLLEQNRFAGPRRRHNQAALALAHGRHQVDDPHVQFVRLRLEDQTLLRMQRRQVAEHDLVGEQVRVLEVDRLDAQQGEILL